MNLENAIPAIKAIMLNNEKLRTVARFYDFPRTTLKRYIDNVKQEFTDISSISDENLLKTMRRGTYAASSVSQVS